MDRETSKTISPVTECFKLLARKESGTAEAQTAARMLSAPQRITTLAMLADFQKASIWFIAGKHEKASTFYATIATKDLKPYRDLRTGKFEDNYRFIREIPAIADKLQHYYEFIADRQGSPVNSRTVFEASCSMIRTAPVDIVNSLQCELARHWGLDVEKYRLSEPTTHRLGTNFAQLFYDRDVSLKETQKAQTKSRLSLV